MQRKKKWNYKPVIGTFHRCEGCKIFLPCVRRCKYKAKRVPDDKECEMAAPSPVKNVADAAECSSQKADTADTPAGQKTDANTIPGTLQPDSQPHGLTICEGTAWAYTMMNWA